MLNEGEEKIDSIVALKFDSEGMKNTGLSILGSERFNPLIKQFLTLSPAYVPMTSTNIYPQT